MRVGGSMRRGRGQMRGESGSRMVAMGVVVALCITCVMVVVTMLVLVSQVWVGGIQIAVTVVKVVMEAGSGGRLGLTVHSLHHGQHCCETETVQQHCQDLILPSLVTVQE